jgi:hypothetical protein
VAANNGLGYGTTGYRIEGKIREERLHRIQEILDKLEFKQRRPNWNSELEYVLKGGGEFQRATVNCDVYAEDRENGLKYSFELKAPLPNSDQTKVSKEKILKLYSMEPRPIDGAFYALPYNPYGTLEDYSWGFPARWFNMQNDEVVLIGNDFWDKIGPRDIQRICFGS